METQSPQNALWIRRYHPAPDSGTRLVCMPHAGGSASFFHPVSKALTPALETLCVQYPGRQDRRREPNIDNIGELADRVYEALLPWSDRPMAFFGHSFGSVLAFEVALRIGQQGGIELTHLFASGRRAPSRYRNDQIHLRDDAGIIEEIRSLSGTESAVLGDIETLNMILPSVRSDYKAIETYRHQPGAMLDIPVTVLVGDQDKMTSLTEAQAWSEHTTGPFELKVYPGGHFYLIKQSAQVFDVISSKVSRVAAP